MIPPKRWRPRFPGVAPIMPLSRRSTQDEIRTSYAASHDYTTEKASREYSREAGKLSVDYGYADFALPLLRGALVKTPFLM